MSLPQGPLGVCLIVLKRLPGLFADFCWVLVDSVGVEGFTCLASQYVVQ